MEIQADHIVSQIKQLSGRIFERILSERNIDAFNGAQGRILYILWQEEGISLKELSDRTGLAATLLTLTEKARTLQPEYTEVSNQMCRIYYAGFSEEEIMQCEAMPGRIHENLKRYKV